MNAPVKKSPPALGYPSLRQRLWRRLMWHRRLGSALCAAVAVFAALDVLQPPEPSSIVVLTAIRDLPAGKPLQVTDVTGVRYPRRLAPEGSLTDPAQVEGHSLSAGTARGTPMTRASLAGDGWAHLEKGHSAVAVRLQDSALADLLAPGQRVRLISIDPRTPSTAQTLVESAVVLALPPPDPRGPGGTTGRLAVFDVPTTAAGIVASSAVSQYLTAVWGP